MFKRKESDWLFSPNGWVFVIWLIFKNIISLSSLASDERKKDKKKIKKRKFLFINLLWKISMKDNWRTFGISDLCLDDDDLGLEFWDWVWSWTIVERDQ